jgi:hypothetical protein
MGPNDAFSGQWGTFWIESYVTEPPLHADGTPCTLTITEVSPAGLAGHAECNGLRWFNAYDYGVDPDRAKPLPDLPPFDLSVTFEARP